MLGKIDFASAPSFEPVPAGEYDGQTATWEARPTKAGDSTNIEGKFTFSYDDEDGNSRNRSILCRWNLKPESLWRLKRDLVAMGADPSEFESNDVDLEGILNSLFGAVPTPVTLSLTQKTFTPEGGEARLQNEVTRIVART